MQRVRSYQSDGRDWEEWQGSISELRQLIPTFTIQDFRIGSGINKYKCVIVREPYGEVDIGTEMDSVQNLRIPIEVVRKQYEGTKWEHFTPKLSSLGYGLIQHYDLLDRVLETLQTFSEAREENTNSTTFDTGIAHITKLTDTESVKANLEISTYGERIKISFLIPNYKYDVDGKCYVLNVVCRNSMDKRIAVEVNLYLLPEDAPRDLFEKPSFQGNISFKGFYSRHEPDDLKEGEIERQLSDNLSKIANGRWFTKTIDPGEVIDIIPILPKTIGKQLIAVLPVDGRVSLGWLRKELSFLAAQAPKVIQGDNTQKIHELFEKIDKVLEEEEKNRIL